MPYVLFFSACRQLGISSASVVGVGLRTNHHFVLLRGKVQWKVALVGDDYPLVYDIFGDLTLLKDSGVSFWVETRL